MKSELLKTALRQNAIVVSDNMVVTEPTKELNETTMALVANCAKLGFAFSEDLLRKVNTINPQSKLEIYNLLQEVTGVTKNWTPLVKQWDIPTGETVLDHIITFFANVFQSNKGTKLSCGHIIPDNTFPIERYNGCPFCGTPFEFGKLEYTPGVNKLKTLKLWSDSDLFNYLVSLLESPVAPDATQAESLKVLLAHFGLPEKVTVAIKETMMLVIDILVEHGEAEVAGRLFQSPNDILRYLWYKHTGFLQIIEPKTIVKRMSKNSSHLHLVLDKSGAARVKAVKDLKLKFNRAECIRYAKWLNSLTMDVSKQCEVMHPKRGIWVRVIRALRLAEYSKREGFERLTQLLDVFYNENYEVWQGKVNEFKLKNDELNTFTLLKQRPGLFARSLFSNMLWFGKDTTLAHFREVMHEVPPRLIFTLNMYAEVYFDKTVSRGVKPLGGVNKRVAANKLLQLYREEELKSMQMNIRDLSMDVIQHKFKMVETANRTIYIDKGLYNIPIAIGDRSENVQDLPGALMGTRFAIEGNKVRLFMQWGQDLPAQHLDMDLSCTVAYEHKTEICSFSNLVTTGCKHSGDIREIPDKAGTAEYIELNVAELAKHGAKFVTFACNAYSNGSIPPNLVVGWMNSKYPMKIAASGVAYDPTAVQHQVRVKNSLAKGMAFGVLDVSKREIIWLELSFGGQLVQNLDNKGITALLKKLDAKLKIGTILEVKANAQGLKIVEDVSNADEVYDMNWALNTAEVSKMLLS
ncbi:MAG: hypothetical protein ACK40G_14785 [Cytophagaceae bacterium]